MNDCVAFKGTGCIKDNLDDVLSFKGEANKVKSKIVDYNLYMVAHNGSGFDSCVVLSNLPQWRSVINSNKNGATNISPKIFNGYFHYENRKNPQNVNFRCGRVHNINSLKKIGISYKFQRSLLNRRIGT